MALCSTGCMSMGGSDAPRSINCELGVPGSSTICLNSPTVRSLAGVPAGAIALCNFYGKASVAPIGCIEYAIVGGGGIADRANAGGAGGVLIACKNFCDKTTYTITVSGGAIINNYDETAPMSCIDNGIGFACGGGRGGKPVSFTGGSSGGSYGGPGPCGSGPGCVNRGGCGFSGYSTGRGGGGGGAGCPGCNADTGGTSGGPGGWGITACIFQYAQIGDDCWPGLVSGPRYVGGGGGGSAAAPNHPNHGLGGLGGGGSALCTLNGKANTGGGGGGKYPAGPPPFANGGSGAVFLRYPSGIADAVCTTGSPCYCCTGGWKLYKFLGSGTIRW